MLWISIPTPGFPHFCYMLDANLGSLLHRDVSVMIAYYQLGNVKQNIYISVDRDIGLSKRS